MKRNVERWNETVEHAPFQRFTPKSWNGETVDIPAVVLRLLGEPNRRASRGAQWRYGAKGSLAVDVARGLFTDFETGEGGGLLDLVRRVRGGSRADAARWIEEQGYLMNPSRYSSLSNLGQKATSQASATRSNRRQADDVYRPRAGSYHAPAKGGEKIRSDMWERLWHASLPPEGSIVARYLEGRGLLLPSEPGQVLRYHPACPFGPDRLPAMVALIRNAETGEPQGVHRTPLTPAGERARGPDGVKLPKMVLGAASGGAIMLSPDWQVEAGIAIAEGIESALAGLSRRPWLPVWAALSASGVRSFPLLAGVDALSVYADHDAKSDGSDPGLESAWACVERWVAAGRYAEVLWPRTPGSDMADLMLIGSSG